MSKVERRTWGAEPRKEVSHEDPVPAAESLTDVPMHYCPGCTHGIIHQLVAEAMVELGCEPDGGGRPGRLRGVRVRLLQLRCQEAAHGRAPAVATGIKRVHPDNIVFTYQGDGDLASIGMAEIVHAAMRGENITVVFVNNAIYGMTGGQMAPTTMLGQATTTTSPLGRDRLGQGAPLRVCEMLATIEATAYIARVSVHTIPRLNVAKRALKKALPDADREQGIQPGGGAFDLPDQLGPVAGRALRWVEQNMIPVYPLGRVQGHRRRKPKPEANGRGRGRQCIIVIAGFGGQGILMIGKLLAHAGMKEGKQVTWLPSYGPEMRGGTANCNVIISDAPIASPIISSPRDRSS